MTIAKHPLQRLGAFSDDRVWHVEIDGATLRLSDGAKDTTIDVAREPWRVRLTGDELIIDMMRFSADATAGEAVAALLQTQRRSSSEQPTTAGTGTSSIAADCAPSMMQVAPQKRKYADKIGSAGGVVGIIVMFAFPTGGNLLISFIVGAVCGMGGYGVGYSLGSFCDALCTPPESHSAQKDRGAMAVGALVLGIIGLAAWFLPIVGIPIAVVGLVLGGKASSSTSRNIALVGMGLSLICLLLSVGNGLLGAAFNVFQATHRR